MNILFTRWLYPLREPIPLSDSPHFVLDNPRANEVSEVADLLNENYHNKLDRFFPPTAESEFISLDWMITQFRMRFGPSDPYVDEVLAEHDVDSVFMSLAKLWVVARYEDQSVKEEIQHSTEQMRKDEQVSILQLNDSNPIVRNSTKLQNYLSLLSLLIHSEGDRYFGNPILISSRDYPLFGEPFEENLWRSAFIWFLVFSTSDHEETKSSNLAWVSFPYVRERLLEVRNALTHATSEGHGELMMYIGNILRVVEHDARDIRVRFILLVSLLELLLTHNPATNRYNIEDSINRQFRLKIGIMMRQQHPDTDLNMLEKRLKQLYQLRSAIAHGDFKALVKYEAGLCKDEGNKEYMDDLITDSYFYLRNTLEQFLKDPEFVLFLKKF